MIDRDFFLECVGRVAGKSKDQFTIGEFCNAVLRITESGKARRFYNGYVQWLRGRKDREASPEITAQVNIGWCFGEGMPVEQQRMWNDAVGAEHPVFGTALASDKRPSIEEIFAAGQRVGEASKHGKMQKQIAIEKERFSQNAKKEGDA